MWQLVSWCFKPSQPQRIISGLRETFTKRYIVERTNKAEIKPEEQIEKAESFRENSWKEIQLKGPQRQKQTQEQNKKEWASSVSLCHRHKPQHSHHVKVGPRGLLLENFRERATAVSATCPYCYRTFRERATAVSATCPYC